MSSLLSLYAESRNSVNVWLAFSGTMLSGLAIVFHNSLLALIVHLTSLAIFIGFIHQPRLRLAHMALFTFFSAYIQIIIDILKGMENIFQAGKYRKQALHLLSVMIVPFMLIIFSIIIFIMANPRFERFTENMVVGLKSYILDWNIYFILFNVWVLFLIIGTVFKKKLFYILLWEQEQIKQTGESSPSTLGDFTSSQLASYDRWFYAILAINIVLFIYHIIEIDWLWLSPSPPTNISLRLLAYRSLYLLFLFFFPSVIALGILWRKKAYFVHVKGKLRTLALIWIGQQFVLLLSILLRFSMYVGHHGMGYARMGVILILTICVISLVALFMTIWARQATLHFLRFSSWSIYIIFILISMVNWDNVIAMYNLSQSSYSYVDTRILGTLSDKTLPILLEYRDVYPLPGNELGVYYGLLAAKVENFQKSYQKRSLISWNWSDYKTHKYLSRTGYKRIINFLRYRSQIDSWIQQKPPNVRRSS